MATADDLPWTTTRCNRLLRPLSSKLAKLRKELEAPRTADQEPRNVSAVFATKGSPRKTTNFTVPTRHPRGFEKLKDPDWMPDGKGGTARKKTYGGRGAKKTIATKTMCSKSGKSYRPGEIAFTPLIARTGGIIQESPQLHSSPLVKYTKNRGPLLAGNERLQNLKKQMPFHIEKLVKGLSEAYANLLQATTTGEEKRWKGTRSLMGTCLRKIPAYVELEEHFAKLDKTEDDDDDDRDISNEVYLHLEAQYEMRAGQGWRSFKQVVRAHGTSLVCDAVREEILGLETVHLLVAHCLNVSAWDEAEKFLEVFLPMVDPLPVPVTLKADMFDQHRSDYMSMVKSFVDRTGRHRFLYNILDYMVSQELLPLEWLATECMRPVWARLIPIISEKDCRTFDTAFHFLETTLCAGVGLSDERMIEDGEINPLTRQLKPSTRRELRQALDTTFSSLFSVLCSIALVNHNRDDGAGQVTVQNVSWALNALVIALLKQDIDNSMETLDADPEDVQIFAQRAIWAVFSSFLIRVGGCSTHHTMLSLKTPVLLGGINWIGAQYSLNNTALSSILSTLPLIITSTARGTGRIWIDDGFDQLQHLVQTLLSLSGYRLPHKLWTLKRLALESAIEFANDTSNSQHMAFARDIEKNMRMKGRLVIMQSPQKHESPSTNGGFRWEEGIGEWVACTPFSRQNVKRLPRERVRALTFLPTPDQSESEEVEKNLSGNERPQRIPNDEPTSALSTSNRYEDHVLHSSPIKKKPGISNSSLGKRTRQASPKVIIPVKRTRLTTSENVYIAHSELLEETCQVARRARRTRTEIKTLISRLRSQRSRTSLECGQHLAQGAEYDQDIPTILELSSDDSGSQQDLESSWLSANSRRSSPQMCHTESSDTESCITDQGDEYDELSKTPVHVEKRASWSRVLKNLQGRKQRPRARDGIVDDEEESEDELSFH